MVGVLTVDDQAPFLVAAHDLVEATSGFQPLAEVTSAEAALHAIAETAPDMVLVDVHMPGMDGVTLTRRITQIDDPPMVVLVSSYAREQLPSAVHTCGAAAVISKQELSPQRLKELWRGHGRPRPSNSGCGQEPQRRP